MSKSNHIHLWKQNVTENNSSLPNYRGKTEQSSMACSSNSSTNPTISAAELFSQLQLDKISNFYKNLSLNKGKDNVLDPSNVLEGQTEETTQQLVESIIGETSKQQILQILEKISTLNLPERLLLYLRMPGGTPETDPLRQPQNPLGTRSEINHTINWVRSHLEHDPNVSIPKQDVYDDYVSYCARVEIKPLSTADFGKVMKQVFPGIRPRRLGTRGHSRYCYAAMRKATKLEPPSLPELRSNPYNNNVDENSWKIIKSWAEGLLNTTFDTEKDLAAHITKHANSPSSSSTSNNSKQMLQKKVLQRDLKERKKSEIAAQSQKQPKRRKKKTRSSSNASEVTSQQESFDSKVVDNIKTEVDDETCNPINLSSDQNQFLFNVNQGTNLSTRNIDDGKTPSSSKTMINPNQQNIPIKKEMTNENLYSTSNIMPNEKKGAATTYCKKVRQAQQSKNVWENQTINQNQQLIYNNDELKKQQNQQQINVDKSDNSAMLLPPKRVTVKDPCFSFPFRKRSKNVSNIQTASSDISGSSGSDGPLNLNTSSEKTDDDFPIPRERVISICNLDKDALDDYLNGGDNSQEQEAELLQYFQNNTEKSDEDDLEDLGQAQSSIPLLENYQLFSDSKQDKTDLNDSGNCDKISQLRIYLQQNLQNVKQNVQLSENPQPSTTYQQNVIIPGSASASLAMLSQRHHHHQHQNTTNTTENPNRQTMIKGPKRKLNLNIPSTHSNNPITTKINILALQSPNTRRRNLNFVPISPGPQSPQVSAAIFNNSQNYHLGVKNQNKNFAINPFLSPTVAQLVKTKSSTVTTNRNLAGNSKLTLLNLPAVSENIINSMMNSNNSTFSNNNNLRTNIKTEVSASAPPSPVVPVPYHNPINYHFSSIAGSQQPHCSSDVYPMESRSQSVPLHCQSPALSGNFDYPGYSTTCNSVAQTPVPSEFTDFTESSLLDMFVNETTPNIQPVKIESNEFIPSLMNNDISVTRNTSLGINDLLPELDYPSTYNQMSRSVPSTPLPISVFGNCMSNPTKLNKSFDNSKSVPTTPITTNKTPFRYSPQPNRDFLINGISMERGKLNSYYQSNSQSQSNINQVLDKDLSISDTIDDLSNFDNVTDPILSSDILNNL